MELNSIFNNKVFREVGDTMSLSVGRSLQNNYNSLASMKKINKAADNAAGLTIAEGLKSQESGYSTGVRNAQAAKNLYQTAEGGLNSIKESLQRMRELGVQASNGIYADDDKQAMQHEIEQLKGSIQDAAKGTEFNTIKVLNGGAENLNTATGPDGKGSKIQIANSTLDTLGIAEFDVTKDFDLSDIDKALEKVSDSMTGIGASSNALDHRISYNEIAEENLTGARSKIEDLDVGKEISDMKKNEILEKYRMFAQSAQSKSDASIVQKLLHG